MPDRLNATVRLFADDTIVYLTVTSETDIGSLHTDLDKLGIWELKWKMEIHPGECNVLTIIRKANPIYHQYTLHDHILESVRSAKYLGCHITSNMQWSDNISSICGKANKTLGFLRRNVHCTHKFIFS